MILEELASVLGLHINESQWKAGERAVEGMKRGLEQLGEKSGLSNLISAGIASFVGYEAINGVKEMVLGVVELGSALNDTAQKTGLSVEALQFYGYVAKLNSADTEMLAGGAEKLAHTLNDVKDAANPAAVALKDMGIKFNDASFKGASMDDKMKIIAEHLSKMPDGAKKTADAIALFGRSGAQLIPTLNDLGKNGAALRSEFEELGGGLSKANVAALDDFGDTLDKTKFGFQALKNEIVIGALPVFKEMLASFQAWFKANRAIIAQKAQDFVRALASALRIVAQVLGSVIDGIVFLSNHLEAAVAIAVVLGGIFAPWATLIAGIAFVVKSVWDAFENGKGPLAGVAKYVLGVIESIKAALKDVKDFASSVWDGIKTATGYNGIKRAAGAVSDLFGGGPSDGGPTTAQVFSGQGFTPQAAPTPTAPSDPYASSQAGSMQFSTPISVTIQGGDPAQVQQAVKSAVIEAQKDMLRQAMNAVKGGRS